MAKNREGVDSISGLSANKFHCPALAWKEQPVTLYSMISQIPGAGSTCYTLLESVKSTLSSANNCLFIFNFLVHEMQLPLLYNLDSTSACLLLPMVIQISSRLVLHQMKTRGKYLRSTNTVRWFCYPYLWIFLFFGLVTCQLEKWEDITLLKNAIDWFPKNVCRS